MSFTPCQIINMQPVAEALYRANPRIGAVLLQAGVPFRWAPVWSGYGPTGFYVGTRGNVWRLRVEESRNAAGRVAAYGLDVELVPENEGKIMNAMHVRHWRLAGVLRVPEGVKFFPDAPVAYSNVVCAFKSLGYVGPDRQIDGEFINWLMSAYVDSGGQGMIWGNRIYPTDQAVMQFTTYMMRWVGALAQVAAERPKDKFDYSRSSRGTDHRVLTKTSGSQWRDYRMASERASWWWQQNEAKLLAVCRNLMRELGMDAGSLVQVTDGIRQELRRRAVPWGYSYHDNKKWKVRGAEKMDHLHVVRIWAMFKQIERPTWSVTKKEMMAVWLAEKLPAWWPTYQEILATLPD